MNECIHLSETLNRGQHMFSLGRRYFSKNNSKMALEISGLATVVLIFMCEHPEGLWAELITQGGPSLLNMINSEEVSSRVFHMLVMKDNHLSTWLWNSGIQFHKKNQQHTLLSSWRGIFTSKFIQLKNGVVYVILKVALYNSWTNANQCFLINVFPRLPTCIHCFYDWPITICENGNPAVDTARSAILV